MSVHNSDELTAAEVRTLFQEALGTELTRAGAEFQFGMTSEILWCRSAQTQMTLDDSQLQNCPPKLGT